MVLKKNVRDSLLLRSGNYNSLYLTSDYYSSATALRGKLGWDNLYIRRKKQN